MSSLMSHFRLHFIKWLWILEKEKLIKIQKDKIKTVKTVPQSLENTLRKVNERRKTKWNKKKQKFSQKAEKNEKDNFYGNYKFRFKCLQK